MSKEIIGVDVDDVLAAHIPSFVDWSNSNYGTNLTEATYQEVWRDIWDVEFSEVLERARIFHDERVAGFEIIEGAPESLSLLKENYDLSVVTARPEWNIDRTHKWIEENFKGIFKSLHFVPIWETDTQVTKAEICREIGADYLIDDLPKHCNVAAEVGVKALLFGGYEWSREHEVHDDVVVVKNWQEVLEYFDA